MVSAPKMLSTANTTSQATTVVIGEPQLSSLIRKYDVRIQGSAQNHTCSAKANSDVVHCQLDGLQPNTAYTALVKACLLAEAGCGKPSKVSFQTPAA